MKGKPQLYGLFEKQKDGTFRRIFPALAFLKPQAVVHFQTALLSPYFEGGPIRELKPVGHAIRPR